MEDKRQVSKERGDQVCIETFNISTYRVTQNIPHFEESLQQIYVGY